jgi:hypothetical protein
LNSIVFIYCVTICISIYLPKGLENAKISLFGIIRLIVVLNQRDKSFEFIKIM